MAQVDLTTKIGTFLTLRHPLWIASAHRSHKESIIRSWKDLSPAALTLKTSRKVVEAETKSIIRQKTDKILPRFGRSLYSDGPKQEELLPYERTRELLQFAKAELSETKVGISVLASADEDYAELHKMCDSADFVELNLKYSLRVRRTGTEQYPEALGELFSQTAKETEKFCKAFANKPVFIKIPRELSWIPNTKEHDLLLGLLSAHKQAGIIVANTLKIDIPDFLAEGVEKHLAGGVISGERLFDETIKLITQFRPSCEKAGIPIVATGGMVSPAQVLTAFWAGASAVQLCTTFDYFGLNQYQTLLWNIQNRAENRGLSSFSAYIDRLRDEGSASIFATPFMYYENFQDEEFQKRIQQDVRRSTRMDIFVMSGKTLFERWTDPLKQRFSNNLGIRVLLPNTNGAAYIAIQEAWGLSHRELEARQERVGAAKQELEGIWKQTAEKRQGKEEKAVKKIFETEKCPFYSFYLFDDKVYIAQYPFLRPSDLGSPVYVFSAGSPEYSRIEREAEGLMAFAEQVASEPVVKKA